MCPPPKFEIFLIFSNFLRFYVLNHSPTHEETCYQVCYTRYQVSFYLKWIGSLLYCKVRKHYDHDCLKIFFLIFTIPMVIKISEKMAIWLKNFTSIKKLPITKVESYLKWNLLCKSNRQNNAYREPLNLEL